MIDLRWGDSDSSAIDFSGLSSVAFPIKWNGPKLTGIVLTGSDVGIDAFAQMPQLNSETNKSAIAVRDSIRSEFVDKDGRIHSIRTHCAKEGFPKKSV